MAVIEISQGKDGHWTMWFELQPDGAWHELHRTHPRVLSSEEMLRWVAEAHDHPYRSWKYVE